METMQECILPFLIYSFTGIPYIKDKKNVMINPTIYVR